MEHILSQILAITNIGSEQSAVTRLAMINDLAREGMQMFVEQPKVAELGRKTILISKGPWRCAGGMVDGYAVVAADREIVVPGTFGNNNNARAISQLPELLSICQTAARTPLIVSTMAAIPDGSRTALDRLREALWNSSSF